MSVVLGFILSLTSGVLALLVGVFVVEVIAAVLCGESNTSSAASAEGLRGSVAILVPAHNEGATLLPTLLDLKLQLEAGDRLLVVADNCEDHTATVGKAAGAEVIERREPNRRGKGYALDFGLSHLRSDPPCIVIIVDADCRVAASTVDVLARTCAQTGRPVQALDLMVGPKDSAIDYRFAEFAWRVKNWVRPLGLKALALPCQLMGTGMAFPWPIISAANVASADIVEDLKLGLDLARVGQAPLFCPSAVVTSEFPSSRQDATSQRQRWEGGHLKKIAGDAIPLIVEGITRRNRDLLVLALDMCVPPLTFLVLANAIAVAIAAPVFVVGLSPMPLLISGTSLASFLFAAALCWFKFGRDLLPIHAWSALGSMLSEKVRLYLSLLAGIPSQWIRSGRGTPHIGSAGCQIDEDDHK